MTQRPDDKEWDEFLQWLEFKRQRSQETTVVVSCEQQELLLEQEELPIKDKPADWRCLDRSAPNAGKIWSVQESRIAMFAYSGGCPEHEIAKHLGRTLNAVEQEIDKIRNGLVKRES